MNGGLAAKPDANYVGLYLVGIWCFSLYNNI